MSEMKRPLVLGGGGKRPPLVLEDPVLATDSGLRATRFDDHVDPNGATHTPKAGKKPKRNSRRDPAPSIWAYRFQRLWLTPLFRALLRVGVPAFSVVFLVVWWLSDQNNSDALNLKIAEFRQAIEERPEFMVKSMAITGASMDLAEDIREILPLNLPASSFHIDLVSLRNTVEELDAVSSANVHVRSGGVLEFDVQQRQAVIVFRKREGFELLALDGHLVQETKSREAGGPLPLIAGDGAERYVREALDLHKAAAPLHDRLKGLVRMGDRRWDLVLDRDQRILLPEKNPISALDRVIAVNSAQDLLARDLTIIDMRNAARPTIRLAENAVSELRRIKGLELGVASQ